MSDQPGKALEAEIAAYEAHHEELRRAYPEDHWVVVKGTEINGVYADVDQAVTAADERFGEQPYLLRQVKPIPFVLPSCLRDRANRGGLPNDPLKRRQMSPQVVDKYRPRLSPNIPVD